MKRRPLEEIERMLEEAVSALGIVECIRLKDGKACTAQHEGKLDKEGRTVFYFATDCKVVQNFCPSCLAYWHVAVARNCLFDLARVTR